MTSRHTIPGTNQPRLNSHRMNEIIRKAKDVYDGKRAPFEGMASDVFLLVNEITVLREEKALLAKDLGIKTSDREAMEELNKAWRSMLQFNEEQSRRVLWTSKSPKEEYATEEEPVTEPVPRKTHRAFSFWRITSWFKR